MSDRENASISSTHIGKEDHGHFTLQIHFSGAAWGQSGGGYAYNAMDGGLTRQIMGIIETLGVDCWEKVKGQHCRVLRDDGRGRIVGLGHLIEDRWHRFGP